jgi:hypothetical protein
MKPDAGADKVANRRAAERRIREADRARDPRRRRRIDPLLERDGVETPEGDRAGVVKRVQRVRDNRG